MSGVNNSTISTVFKWANCYLVGFSNNMFKKHCCSLVLRDFINWNIACRILKLVQVNSTKKRAIYWICGDSWNGWSSSGNAGVIDHICFPCLKYGKPSSWLLGIGNDQFWMELNPHTQSGMWGFPKGLGKKISLWITKLNTWSPLLQNIFVSGSSCWGISPPSFLQWVFPKINDPRAKIVYWTD